MKTDLWKNVKAGDYLIYADEDDGVHKVKVTEINIKVETFDPEYKAEYPYGTTEDKGYVKVYWKENDTEQEIVENLASLIRFVNSWYTDLKAKYDKWQLELAEANDEEETFTSRRSELQAK